MNSLVNGLRYITLHRGRSITRTVTLTVTSKRDIHRDNITFKHPEHVNTEEKEDEALDATVEFAAISGLDAAGAVYADIALVPLCYTFCCLQSDQPCLVEVPTIMDLVLTSFGV